MYDYVIQLSINKKFQRKVNKLKNILKNNKIEDTERNWLPHITIDIYNCGDEIEFIKRVDLIVKSIKSFYINCNKLNDFDKKTLYIDQLNKKELLTIKEKFDKALEKYRLQNRKSRVYKPHITLCTNENIEAAKAIAENNFKNFVAEVKYLWVYNRNMRLIKEYKLRKKIK